MPRLSVLVWHLSVGTSAAIAIAILPADFAACVLIALANGWLAGFAFGRCHHGD